MSLVRRRARQALFVQQADALVSQANPVSTTWYTVLDTTANVRITSIAAKVTWAVTQPNPLEVRVTIDGKSVIFQMFNPVTATPYYAGISPDNTDVTQALNVTVASALVMLPYLLEGRSVKVEVRITWAVTQPDPLGCRVKWAMQI